MKTSLLLLLLICLSSCGQQEDTTGCSGCDTITTEVSTETIFVKVPPFVEPRLNDAQNQLRLTDFLSSADKKHSIDDISYYSRYRGRQANFDGLLYVQLTEDGQIMINSEKQQNTESLTKTLKEVFEIRAKNGVFEEGSDRVVKAVGIQVPTSAKYADFFKIATAVRHSGADPIVLLLDGHIPKPMKVSWQGSF